MKPEKNACWYHPDWARVVTALISTCYQVLQLRIWWAVYCLLHCLQKMKPRTVPVRLDFLWTANSLNGSTFLHNSTFFCVWCICPSCFACQLWHHQSAPLGAAYLHFFFSSILKTADPFATTLWLCIIISLALLWKDLIAVSRFKTLNICQTYIFSIAAIFATKVGVCWYTKWVCILHTVTLTTVSRHTAGGILQCKATIFVLEKKHGEKMWKWGRHAQNLFVYGPTNTTVNLEKPHTHTHTHTI